MAYMRVTRTEFDPARYDAVVQAVTDSLTAIEQLPGFQHNHAAIDRASGKGIGITVFDTLEHAQFSRDAVAASIMSRMAAASVTAMTPEFYEVLS